ncbi:MAG: PAS domain S-box protein, partial [Firmicutes bacterium]|nr:PAS domain S-box protein [Bacillota bacterium]
MTEKEKDDLIEALRDYYRDSIFVTDGNGNVIFANDVASQRVGLPMDELRGRNVHDMVEEGVYSYSTVMEAIRTKREVAAEINSTDDLHTFSNSVPVFNEKGDVRMVVTNNMSIERSKEWEEIIGREKQKADMLRRELDYLRLRDKRVIIANSREMKDILNSVNSIASSDANIVILGESGT